MNRPAKEPLGPFALLILRPTWIGGKPRPADRTGVAWEGVGVQGVPITALRDGIVIFKFDKSDDYAGGAVPAYTLPENRRIPREVTSADEERDKLGYRRFIYMNAFLLALYSGLSTVQKRGTNVQEPVDSTNYFLARRTDGKWDTYMDYGRKVNYTLDRSDNIEIETLDHSLEILQMFHTAVGEASLKILSLVYTSCAQYSRHQFSSAHLIAWSAIEALLNVMWSNLHVEIDSTSGGHTQISGKRKALLKGRDYTASVVSQVLSICGKIDDDTLERLDEARRKRNAFAHDLILIKADDAGKAIRLATDMITNVAGIGVTSQLSYSSWM